MKRDYIAELVELCIKLANVVDENKGYCNSDVYSDDLGLGYKAFTSCLRRGAKSVIELQSNYYNALERIGYANATANEAEELLEDIFGDRDAAGIPDSYKEKFKELLKELDGESKEN